MIGEIISSHVALLGNRIFLADYTDDFEPPVIDLLDVMLLDEEYLVPPHLSAGCDELHLVFSPLCVTTAEKLCSPNRPIDDWRLIALFWQRLAGIEYAIQKG